MRFVSFVAMENEVEQMFNTHRSKVDGKDLPALELGDSAKLEQGAPMVALGNPYGLKNSVVGGVISEVREMEGRRMLMIIAPRGGVIGVSK